MESAARQWFSANLPAPMALPRLDSYFHGAA
jgi:hypothetical protein